MSSSTRPIPSAERRFLTGLIGAPIAHSASPAMHERAAQALGVHCHYQLIEIAGAGRGELHVLLEGIRRLGFAGVNVTFPYKEAVVDLLDELSPDAAAIGAVNTVLVRNGRLIGCNTDRSGFARSVADLLAKSASGPVALLGAGGVGKAIAFALASLEVAELRIFDTDRVKAEQLAALLPARQRTRIADSVADALQGAVGLVNGTPVGMLPSRASPVPESLLHGGLWVVDAVYSPLRTPLLVAAGTKGATVMTGRDLAIHQAADAFELFTGLKPSIVEMGIAFDGVTAKNKAAAAAA